MGPTDGRTGSSLVLKPGVRIGKRGVALIEFALILPILLLMALAVIDVGRLIQVRLIVTNVAREGGSLASRQTNLDQNLISLLQSSSNPPMDMSGANGKIYITRIHAGTGSAPNNVPTIATQLTGGTLPWNSGIDVRLPRLGLSQRLYNHLVYRVQPTTPPQSASDITEITVVEVYSKYRPITPLPNFMFKDVLLRDVNHTGMVVSSKAIF
jgi:Flp pilus assembly protein TadG